MEYNFWGWQNATAPAITDDYKGIHTPIDLYDALTHIWCADTCAPRLRDGWTEDNKTLGQCSITAFLAQDIFGGDPVQERAVHFAKEEKKLRYEYLKSELKKYTVAREQ